MLNVVSEEKKSVLITGVAGYIGSHVLAGLLAEGYAPQDIYGIDNFVTGERFPLLDLINFTELDLQDLPSTIAKIGQISPDVIIHLAGNRFARQSTSDPFNVYSSNVISTINLAEAVRICGNGPDIIFSSSCSVYGNPVGTALETDPLNPISPYGRSKVFCEQILEDFSKSGGGTPIILRYFNAAGYFPPARSDEAREGLLANLIHHANNQTDLPIFGTSLPTPDGTCIRDYVSVMDIASAHLAILRYLKLGLRPNHLSYNIGSGVGTSVLEIVDMFNRQLHCAVGVTAMPSANADPSIVSADSSRFAAEFDWNAQDDVATIIRSLLPLVR
jgi:UDP-glucose 4-epimerase